MACSILIALASSYSSLGSTLNSAANTVEGRVRGPLLERFFGPELMAATVDQGTARRAATPVHLGAAVNRRAWCSYQSPIAF